MEKKRLADRREGFIRYDPEEAVFMTKDSSAYISGSVRDGRLDKRV